MPFQKFTFYTCLFCMIPRIPFEAVQSVEIVIHLLNINPYTNYLLIESCKLIETVACRWHTLDKQRIIILYASFYFYSLSSDLQMDFVCAQKHYACMRVRLASTDKMPAQIFNSSEPITPANIRRLYANDTNHLAIFFQFASSEWRLYRGFALTYQPLGKRFYDFFFFFS